MRMLKFLGPPVHPNRQVIAVLYIKVLGLRTDNWFGWSWTYILYFIFRVHGNLGEHQEIEGKYVSPMSLVWLLQLVYFIQMLWNIGVIIQSGADWAFWPYRTSQVKKEVLFRMCTSSRKSFQLRWDMQFCFFESRKMSKVTKSSGRSWRWNVQRIFLEFCRTIRTGC